MLDALKTLFENDVVSEEVRHEIEEAWNQRIKENRQTVTAELREEFAQKYEHDKSTMVEAIDSMVSERLASEIEEFADDRKQLAEAKAKYAVAMRENATLLRGFVVESLAKEVNELHEDQKRDRIVRRHSRLPFVNMEVLVLRFVEVPRRQKSQSHARCNIRPVPFAEETR